MPFLYPIKDNSYWFIKRFNIVLQCKRGIVITESRILTEVSGIFAFSKFECRYKQHIVVV